MRPIKSFGERIADALVEDGLLSTLRGKNVDILTNIRDSRDLNDDTATKLRSVVEGFAKTFA